LLVNEPDPVPWVVWELLVVGFAAVPQHIPRAVTGEPPSEVIFPPLFAVVAPISVTAAVVKTGLTERVLNVTSFPYATPAEFLAYALTW